LARTPRAINLAVSPRAACEGGDVSAGRHRDRHGRGLRGRLLPPYVVLGGRRRELPAWRSRTDRFDDVVRAAFADLEPHWARELADVELAVEDVPPAVEGDEHGLVADETAGGAVPLGRAVPAEGSRPARVVVYRRPVEARAEDLADLGDLVHDVLVDAVAQLLGRDPDEVDPT
jgi:predicted Zn-dependent protease with MMP-like domain